jgi:hypothetical protein
LAFGWRVYGLGIMASGIVCLALGDFLPGQPMPKNFPDRTALAYAAGAFMLIAGAAIEWRRTVVWAAGALTAYYAFVVVMLMDGHVVLAHYAEFIAYSNTAMQVAIAAGGLIVFSAGARIEAGLAARLIRVGQVTFGVCALFFGGSHFLYTSMTVPLVPKWLPPTQQFWAYATGAGFIAAGVAILTGVQARLAAILLTAMFGSFTVLVLGPLLLANPSIHLIWIKNATNLVTMGAAWVVADSLATVEEKSSAALNQEAITQQDRSYS